MAVTDKDIERSKKWKTWRESEDAKLFESFKNAWGNASADDATWQGSNAGLRKKWDKAEQKQQAFLDRFCELAGLENPYEI